MEEEMVDETDVEAILTELEGATLTGPMKAQIKELFGSYKVLPFGLFLARWAAGPGARDIAAEVSLPSVLSGTLVYLVYKHLHWLKKFATFPMSGRGYEPDDFSSRNEEPLYDHWVQVDLEMLLTP
eukprot:GILI01032783.1.p1 GENE.GILI01032783.1~~GILI01032783.1.p1  ORF type:complete len:126 (+),score=21.45 GILI01032783.1:154-531(+)